TGWLGDRKSKQTIGAVGVLLGAAGLVVLAYGDGVWWALVLFAVLFSFGDGINSVTWALVGDVFGRAHFATIRGWISMFQSFASLPPPAFTASVYAPPHTYPLPLRAGSLHCLLRRVRCTPVADPLSPARRGQNARNPDHPALTDRSRAALAGAGKYPRDRRFCVSAIIREILGAVVLQFKNWHAAGRETLSNLAHRHRRPRGRWLSELLRRRQSRPRQPRDRDPNGAGDAPGRLYPRIDRAARAARDPGRRAWRFALRRGVDRAD